MVEQLKNPNSNIWQWAKIVATLFIIPLGGWAYHLESRVQAIETTRWTKDDHYAYKAGRTSELAAKADKSNVPPPVVVARLDHLEEVQTRTELRQEAALRRIEISVDRMETLLQRHLEQTHPVMP